MDALLTEPQIKTRLESLNSEWKYGDNAIHIEFTTADFEAGVKLIQRIGVAAEELNHHPDISLRDYDTLTITCGTHDAGGVTEKDIELAKRINTILREEA